MNFQNVKTYNVNLNAVWGLVPAGSPEVSDLDVEEGQEGTPAEGTGGVEVGVVCSPSRHDLLIIDQTVAGLTA